MHCIIFRDHNKFHISKIDEWNQYLSKYKIKEAVLESARKCSLNEYLFNEIQHSTSKLVQRWLREYWSDGECMYI